MTKVVAASLALAGAAAFALAGFCPSLWLAIVSVAGGVVLLLAGWIVGTNGILGG